MLVGGMIWGEYPCDGLHWFKLIAGGLLFGFSLPTAVQFFILHYYGKNIDDKTKKNFIRTLEVNLIGPFLVTKTFADIMQENKTGKVINISSTNGINTYYPMCLEYDASKAALISLTHNLAIEFSPYVNVNAIAPGFIGTESELDGYDEEFLKSEQEKILVGRYGKPEEVAHLVKFLVSDEASYINNTVLRIDGGQYGA